MVIEAQGLEVHRLGRLVLRDVSFTIDHGQCVSIIGPNGAGKSTLMAALLGLIPIRRGQVRLAGTPLIELPRRQLARQVAYVPQLHEGYLGFAVRDVVEAGRYAHLDPLEPPRRQDRTAVARAIETCRIDHLLTRRVDTLSGGERQKVWIAAALAQESPTLFLDEPTAALDPAHQAELIRIMRDFTRGGGTLLVIAHDLNLPLALQGRVIAIHHQSVAFDGPVELLLDPDRLRDLFGTEFVLHRAQGGSAISIQLQV